MTIQPNLYYSLETPMGTPLPAKVYTLHLEDCDGDVRQYGFHLGTIRDVALTCAEERALWHIRHGARSASLRQDGRVVKIWDFRDLPENRDRTACAC